MQTIREAAASTVNGPTRHRYRFDWTKIATLDDVMFGEIDADFPICQEGDLLVSIIGYNPGDEARLENWGTDYMYLNPDMGLGYE